MTSQNIAHIRSNSDGTWNVHSLPAHLIAVAIRAGEFAAEFGNGEKNL